MLNMAYRSTPQESTQVRPNMMMFGREINLPADIMYGKPPCSDYMCETDYVIDLKDKLESVYSFARQELKISANRQKRYYDLTVFGKPYERGDFVWLYQPRNKIGICPKLQKLWQGPYLVLDCMGHAVYKIQDKPCGKIKVVHFDRLKPYKGTKIKCWVENNHNKSGALESDFPDVSIINQHFSENICFSDVMESDFSDESIRDQQFSESGQDSE
jgi:hypothetical protein